jgi:hypothetical protein
MVGPKRADLTKEPEQEPETYSSREPAVEPPKSIVAASENRPAVALGECSIGIDAAKLLLARSARLHSAGSFHFL